MRICIDIDGTICQTRKPHETYLSVQPVINAVRALVELKKNDHYIILYTARHMATCNHNIGQVLARQGKNLFMWLDLHNVPYDEIIFGKPLADIYIDDKAYRFNDDWNKTIKEINKNV